MRISGRSQWVAVAGTVVLIAAIIIYVVASSGSSTSQASGDSAQQVCEKLVDDSGKYEHGSFAWRDRVIRCVDSLPPKD